MQKTVVGVLYLEEHSLWCKSSHKESWIVSCSKWWRFLPTTETGWKLFNSQRSHREGLVWKTYICHEWRHWFLHEDETIHEQILPQQRQKNPFNAPSIRTLPLASFCSYERRERISPQKRLVYGSISGNKGRHRISSSYACYGKRGWWGIDKNRIFLRLQHTRRMARSQVFWAERYVRIHTIWYQRR